MGLIQDSEIGSPLLLRLGNPSQRATCRFRTSVYLKKRACKDVVCHLSHRGPPTNLALGTSWQPGLTLQAATLDRPIRPTPGASDAGQALHLVPMRRSRLFLDCREEQEGW